MTDKEIISLYFSRSERAIQETDKQYGKLCYGVSYNILRNNEDAEECVSDTYMTAWNRIPPTVPDYFSAFLTKIARNLSIDRWRISRAAKRGRGQMELCIHELDRTLSTGQTPEEIVAGAELTWLLEQFLDTLPDTERRVFLCRYWFVESVEEISREFGFSGSKVKSMLFRTRKKLKAYLLEEGGYAV